MLAVSGGTSVPRVLIVEDDLMTGEELRLIVERMGYWPLGPIPAVAPALAVAHEVPLAAALLDVQIDSDQAFPVAELLEQRNIPYVFVTGDASPIDRWPQFASRLRVIKPFAATAVANALGQCVAPN